VKEAEFHFLIDENKFIDSIDIEDYLKNGIKEISSELAKRLTAHLKNNRDAKYSEKITKRYITTFGKLKSRRLLKRVPTLFNEIPGVRQNLLFYLSILGYSKRTSEIVIQILDELKLHDDISLFNICKLVTDWEIPTTKDAESFISSFIKRVKGFSDTRRKPFDFYCLIWVKTKYEHPEKILSFISKYENLWKSHPFLRRQVTSIMARFLNFRKDEITKFLNAQIATSEPQVVSVANSILTLSNLLSIEKKVNLYLFPENIPKVYPYQKFIVLCAFLNSEVYRANADIKNKILEYISDPYYLKWLDYQYDIK
ncbi:RNA-directed DNA polymerase, partial [Candidatus Woesearchaeota archaeon]|nr:RNA-directed DNA polymerase [Candidatus Woesearchaeota archaeon]